MSNTVTYGALMFLAGVGVPIMAALNAGLGGRIASPVFAAFILFLVAVLVTGGIAVMNPVPSKALLAATPLQYFLGGLCVAVYVLTVTSVAPRIGVGNAIFLALLGQLCAAAVIDHFGLFGSRILPLSLTRFLGLCLMATGIYLAKRQ
jgi:transporter family-2 protein